MAGVVVVEKVVFFGAGKQERERSVEGRVLWQKKTAIVFFLMSIVKFQSSFTNAGIISANLQLSKSRGENGFKGAIVMHLWKYFTS